MRRSHALLLILSAVLLACGGGGGGGSSANNGGSNATSPALAAPSQLTVTESGLDQITLSWVAPAGTFGGYYLEGKVGSGAFQPLNTDPIPSNYTVIILTFSSTAPDAETYTFRIQAGGGGSLSPFSNEAAYLRAPNAPGQASTTYSWTTGAVTLSWNRNTTGSDGLRIERAECTQYGTVTGTWVALPTTDPLAASFADSSISKDLFYAYRITNLKGTRAGQSSPASNPVSTGLTSVAWVNASFDSIHQGVQVSWGSFLPSTADGVMLERSDCDANGTSLGNWATLSLPTGYRTTFLDRAVAEAGRYTYRATYLYGLNASASYQMPSSVSIPLLPPVNLQVVATTGGIQLTWQNQSKAANQVVVRRTPALTNTSDIAILSSSTTSYLDPARNLGYYTYSVVAKNNSSETSGNPVAAATINPPDALALTSTALNLPVAGDAALRPGGGWAFTTTSPFGVLSNNDPWPATFPANAGRTSNPIIQVDRKGWPHAVYATPVSGTSGVSALIHLWYDGTTWQSESIASATIPGSSANQGWTYRLDSTGTPRVILDHATTNDPNGWTSASLSYVHKVSGAWVEEFLNVLTPAITNMGTFDLTLEDSDTPHVLVGYGSSVIDYSRVSVGVWSSTIPAMNIAAWNSAGSLWTDGNNGWVFYVSNEITGQAINVVQMKNGVWLTPQTLDYQAPSGYTGSARWAISPDRSRVAILYASSAGFKTYHQTATGWHQTLVAPPAANNVWTMRIGFDGNQKIHVLLSDGISYTDLHE